MKKKNTIPLLLLPLESSPELSNVGGARSGSMVVARVAMWGWRVWMWVSLGRDTLWIWLEWRQQSRR